VAVALYLRGWQGRWERMMKKERKILSSYISGGSSVPERMAEKMGEDDEEGEKDIE
jgi:hypothetical protein